MEEPSTHFGLSEMIAELDRRRNTLYTEFVEQDKIYADQILALKSAATTYELSATNPDVQQVLIKYGEMKGVDEKTVRKLFSE